MKNAILTQVNINQINLSDRSYIFTFEPLMSQMVQSIKNIGLVNPPILAQISDRPSFRIISGLKRILALIHLRQKTFTAYVFHDELNHPNFQLFLKNFYENISIRELNAIEKSHILNKLIHTFNISEEEIIAKFLPLMGLGSNPKMLQLYVPLIQLEDNLKIAIVEDFFSPETGVQLLKYSHKDRQSIYELFYELKLGKNRQKEFLRLLDDISHIVNKPLAEVINQRLIQTTLNEKNLTITVKSNKIRDLFKKLRFPIYSQAEDKFNELKKELKLPPSIIFRAPPFFENDKYSIEIIFRNEAEFAAALNKLQQVLTDQKLHQLDIRLST